MNTTASIDELLHERPCCSHAVDIHVRPSPYDGYVGIIRVPAFMPGIVLGHACPWAYRMCWQHASTCWQHQV